MSQEIGFCRWGPGPDELSQKYLNWCNFWHHPQKNEIQSFLTFSNPNQKACCFLRGFEQLSRSITWWVLVVQSDGEKVAHLGRKGKLTRKQRC